MLKRNEPGVSMNIYKNRSLNWFTIDQGPTNHSAENQSFTDLNNNLTSEVALFLKQYFKFILSHNNRCFQCNMTISNLFYFNYLFIYFVLHTCEISFQDVIGQSTIHIYSYGKVLKQG